MHSSNTLLSSVNFNLYLCINSLSLYAFCYRNQRWTGHPFVWRNRAETGSNLRGLYHYEPRLCWQVRATRQSKGIFSTFQYINTKLSLWSFEIFAVCKLNYDTVLSCVFEIFIFLLYFLGIFEAAFWNINESCNEILKIIFAIYHNLYL